MSTDAVEASIDVALPPAEAFAAFTDDIDEWYVVDEHTVPDFTRTKAIRFQDGLLVDVYDEDSGDARTIATVTAWEPGARLTFVDARQTQVEVTFAERDGGTHVRLVHSGLNRLPADVAAHVRTYGWHATLPEWFAAWLGKPLQRKDIQFGSVTPYLYYADAGAALDWFERVFGWGPQHTMRDADGAVREGSIDVGKGQRVDVCGREPAAYEGGGALLIVSVSDVDGLYERIKAQGVEVSEPHDEDYGPRQIHCSDPAGYRWYFWQGEAHYPA